MTAGPYQAFVIPGTSMGSLFAHVALQGPLRRAAGERKGPIAKQWVGEVVDDKEGIFRLQRRSPPHPPAPLCRYASIILLAAATFLLTFLNNVVAYTRRHSSGGSAILFAPDIAAITGLSTGRGESVCHADD